MEEHVTQVVPRIAEFPSSGICEGAGRRLSDIAWSAETRYLLGQSHCSNRSINGNTVSLGALCTERTII